MKIRALKIIPVFIIALFIITGCDATEETEDVGTEANTTNNVDENTTNDDTTSPTVLDINLSESNITISFSEPMDSSSIDKSTILVNNQSLSIVGKIEEINSSKFAFIPDQNFTNDVNYTVSVSDSVSDLAGNKLENSFETTLKLDLNSNVSNAILSHTYNSSENNGYGIYKINDHNSSSFNYELNLGDEVKDVYIVFTNPTENNFTTASSVSEISLTSSNTIVPKSNKMILNNIPDSDFYIRPRKDSEELRRIRLANKNPFEYFGIEPTLKTETEANNNDVMFSSKSVTTTHDSVGDSQDLYDTSDNIVPSTCRKVVSNEHNRTLSIWVEDDSWGTNCFKAYCVTQEIVDAFADKFLNSTNDNIFKYVTSFLGDEWGDTSSSSYDSSYYIDFNNQITIFMHDIGSDNSTNGDTAGLFYSRDNFKKSVFPTSNERIMFYVDSIFIAHDGGDGIWDISEYWPSFQISTLVHEFQHMIHFYQKNVSRTNDKGTDTWIDEMMAQTTEDILDTKLQSGGSLNNIDSFNEFYYIPLTDWYSDYFDTKTEVDSKNNYAVSYLFGAYLIRNYGGVEVMQNMMFNNETDYRAVEYAVSKNNSEDANFSKLLQNWGIASVLSDKTDVPQPYSYNSDLNITFNGINYDLKAINLFAYEQYTTEKSGPKIFDKDNLPSGDFAGKSKHSNMFYKVGENLTGNVKIQINTNPDSLITVIAK